MPLRIKKSIQQLSNVDLLEMMLDSGQSDFPAAVDEFKSRNLSEEEIKLAKEQLQVRQRYRAKAAQTPLTFYEKMTAFFVPLVGSGKYSNMEQMGQDLENKYELYGENKKLKEFRKWKMNGFIFYLLIIIIFALAQLG